MGEFLESGALSDPALARAIARRKLFPCFFGSALRLEGWMPFWRRWRPIPCSGIPLLSLAQRSIRSAGMLRACG